MHTEPDISEKLIAIAINAGIAIMKVYDSDDSELQVKADQSPLTAADLASHHLICDALTLEFPSIPVLSEESAITPWIERQYWHTFLLIDPLDGTKEFLKRNGEFTVNVALVKNGIPVAGVVHAPALGKTWYTQNGRAYRRDETGDRLIEASSIDVSPRRIVASRSHADETLEAFLKKCPPHERISMGSSLKLCAVADGSADLYPRLAPTMEWDTAAAHAVCNAAGATVTDPAGEPLTYNKPNLRNPHFIVAAPKTFDWPAALAQSGYQPDDD